MAVTKISLMVIITFCFSDTAGQDVPTLPTFTDIKGLIGEEKDVNLWIVGMYMAAFKYFGTDARSADDTRLLFRQFPEHVLTDVNKELAKACETSAEGCIKEILPIATESGSLQHLLVTKGQSDKYTGGVAENAPFSSNTEMFNFRLTAMYYLCWHTMLGDSYLHFDKSQTSCLEQLYLVDEVPKPEKKFIKYVAKKLKNLLPQAITDVRDLSRMYRRDPLMCARLWFCPDPCYGRESGGNFTSFDGKDSGNPCNDLPSAACDWKTNENKNFEDLIKNKINITCDCASESAGFEWNNEKGMCVDRNGCKSGYVWNPSKNRCEDPTMAAVEALSGKTGGSGRGGYAGSGFSSINKDDKAVDGVASGSGGAAGRSRGGGAKGDDLLAMLNNGGGGGGEYGAGGDEGLGDAMGFLGMSAGSIIHPKYTYLTVLVSVWFGSGHLCLLATCL